MPFALLGEWPATWARVSLSFLHEAGRSRLCGLASVRQDLLLVLLELGLLLPFVHLGHRDNTGGDGAGRRWALFVDGEVERAGRSW